MKLELNLDKIRRIGKQKEDENIDFRVFLKEQDADEVDEIVHQLNKEITVQIDCQDCGNCCKSLKPGLSKDEIYRLAAIDHISIEEYEKKFIQVDEFGGEKLLKDIPCKYLKNKSCTIYSDRPEACRSFPNTHKPGFIFRSMGMISNYEICPIVFNLMERLKVELEYEY